MQIIETNMGGFSNFEVYARNPGRIPDVALKGLIQSLDATHIPYAIGPKPGEALLLLAFGPVNKAQRAVLLEQWDAYLAIPKSGG